MLEFTGVNEKYYKAANETAEYLNINDCEIIIGKSEKSLTVDKKGNKIEILLPEERLVFRALSIIAEKGDTDFCVIETPVFEHLSFMWDQSRNAVTNMKTFRSFIKYLALMGFNSIQLYTEDTYEMEGHPYFGYMRGALTNEELREMDEYAESYGIELIACIQTLAHLNAMFRWGHTYYEVNDINDILLVGDDKTYALIEAMIKNYAENLKSKIIHIGMDEAHMVGRGQYLDKHGYQNRFELMAGHLAKVVEICKKYGLKPLMWSDMFFRLYTGYPYYLQPGKELPQEIADLFPRGVCPVYWDYYHYDVEEYNHMFDQHKKFNAETWFAGGIYRWADFAPHLKKSMKTSAAALESCRIKNIKNLMLTAWGDNGSESTCYSALLAIQLYAEYCFRQDGGEDNLKKRFSICTGGDYDSFMALDKIDRIPPFEDDLNTNCVKYYLYNDPLCGLLDLHIPKDTVKVKEYYSELSNEYNTLADKNPKFELIFKNMAALAKVMELKFDFGIRASKAYKDRNREVLKYLAETEIPEIIARIKNFNETLKNQWYSENKPFGFDVQDIRLGALRARMERAGTTIKDFLEGKSDKIEEYDYKRLSFDNKPTDQDRSFEVPGWQQIATASVLNFI